MNAGSPPGIAPEATEPDPGGPADLSQPAGAPGDSAVDRVTAEVRRLVLNGSMAPGSSFSITDLSERLRVSAIPVREALRRLDAQGLILLRPGRSAIVNPLDVHELRGIYRLRRAIEPDLAARSCHLLSPPDRDRLDALLEAYGKPRDDAEELWNIHHDLHLELLKPAASSWDLRILNQLWHASDRYTRIVFETYNVSDAERKRRYDAHRVLVEASRSVSPFEIRTALTNHLLDNEAACLIGISAFTPVNQMTEAT
jgi:DNA-binding GntR family transcriptional regulator